MTIIVKHRRTGNQYILLGIDREGEKNAPPARFLSDLFAQDRSDLVSSATVCDVRGNIFLAYIDDLIVVSIDGKKPSEILPEEPEPITTERDISKAENSNFDAEDDNFDERKSKSAEFTTASTYESSKTEEPDFDDDEDWV